MNKPVCIKNIAPMLTIMRSAIKEMEAHGANFAVDESWITQEEWEYDSTRTWCTLYNGVVLEIYNSDTNVFISKISSYTLRDKCTTFAKAEFHLISIVDGILKGDQGEQKAKKKVNIKRENELKEETDQLKEENQRLLEIARILRGEVPVDFSLCHKCARSGVCGRCSAKNGWAEFRKKGQ